MHPSVGAYYRIPKNEALRNTLKTVIDTSKRFNMKCYISLALPNGRRAQHDIGNIRKIRLPYNSDMQRVEIMMTNERFCIGVKKIAT